MNGGTRNNSTMNADCEANDVSPKLNIPNTQQSSMPQRFIFKKSLGIYNPPNSNEEQQFRITSDDANNDETLIFRQCGPITDFTANQTNYEPSIEID